MRTENRTQVKVRSFNLVASLMLCNKRWHILSWAAKLKASFGKQSIFPILWIWVVHQNSQLRARKTFSLGSLQ